MPSLNQSQLDNLKTFILGKQVSKSAAVLPATTTQNIFTIAGGRVRVIARLPFGSVPPCSALPATG